MCARRTGLDPNVYDPHDEPPTCMLCDEYKVNCKCNAAKVFCEQCDKAWDECECDDIH